MRFDWGDDLWMEVLHPGTELLSSPGADENNNSVVLRLVYGQMTFLFTGDIEAEAERLLVDSGRPLSAVVLKVSHHGAGEASTEAFLEAVRPQLAVISVGAGNRYHHPAKATLRRLEACGARVLRTDQRGTVEVTTDGAQLWVETDR